MQKLQAFAMHEVKLYDSDYAIQISERWEALAAPEEITALYAGDSEFLEDTMAGFTTKGDVYAFAFLCLEVCQAIRFFSRL